MEDSLAAIMADTSRLLRRTFDERARSIGVTRPQWQVLTVLINHEGSNQGRLAELLDVEPITLCRMIDRLQEADLVERRRDPRDRRAWLVFLTDRGRELQAQLQPLGQAVIDEALQGLSEQECEFLRRSLDRIRQNISRRSTSGSSKTPG